MVNYDNVKEISREEYRAWTKTITVPQYEKQKAAPAWKMNRHRYTMLNMPLNAMGGGVCERILARQHAIHVQNAMVKGENVKPSIVREAHDILGNESKYPRKLIKKYPFLGRS